MDNYTIYCTKEQVIKAFELGAPITKEPSKLPLCGCVCLEEKDDITGAPYWLMPVTAEQMIGWLRAKGFVFYIAEYNDHVFWRVANNHDKIWYKYDDKIKDSKDAIISIINAALEYLKNNNK